MVAQEPPPRDVTIRTSTNCPPMRASVLSVAKGDAGIKGLLESARSQPLAIPALPTYKGVCAMNNIIYIVGLVVVVVVILGFLGLR